jgi:hypothetical protein
MCTTRRSVSPPRSKRLRTAFLGDLEPLRDVVGECQKHRPTPPLRSPASRAATWASWASTPATWASGDLDTRDLGELDLDTRDLGEPGFVGLDTCELGELGARPALGLRRERC